MCALPAVVSAYHVELSVHIGLCICALVLDLDVGELRYLDSVCTTKALSCVHRTDIDERIFFLLSTKRFYENSPVWIL